MKPRRPSSPGGGSSGDASRLTTPLRSVLRCVSVAIHPGQFSRWGLLPHAPCQPGASPLSALTRVPPQAARDRGSAQSHHPHVAGRAAARFFLSNLLNLPDTDPSHWIRWWIPLVLAPTGINQPVNKVNRHSRATRDGSRLSPPSIPRAPGSPRCLRPAPEARARSDGSRLSPPSIPRAPGSARCLRPAPEARASRARGRVPPSPIPRAPGSARCLRPAPEARAKRERGWVSPSPIPSAPGSARCWRPAPEASGDASRLNRSASRRSSLRFGRNTSGPVLPVGAPPSRALSAARLAPTGRTGALGARPTLSADC